MFQVLSPEEDNHDREVGKKARSVERLYVSSPLFVGVMRGAESRRGAV
jgi:hypothetical protein